MKNIICKLTSCILALVFAASFSACGNDASSVVNNTTVPSTEPTTLFQGKKQFDIKNIHSYDKTSNEVFAGIWKIVSGDGKQFNSFRYIFTGNGKSNLIIDNTGYCGNYTIKKDKDSDRYVFTCQMMFGINGEYFYTVSDDKNKITLTNIETLTQTVIEKVEDINMIPEHNQDTVIDEKLVGIWQSDLGEYYYFGSDGLMYHNQYGTMCNYASYTAHKGKLSAEYTMSEVTNEEIEYSLSNDILTIDKIDYKRITEDELLEFIGG